MFPQSSPTGFQQNNGLLLSNQQGQAPMLQGGIADLGNSTAPLSSTTNPAVANMVKALKGSSQ